MIRARSLRRTVRDHALAAPRPETAFANGRERFVGYGVMALPFASGDLLAFRRFDGSTIGPPYSSIWHRDPAGRWTFYVSVEPGRACPRYFGANVDRVVVTEIDHTWIAHDELVVSAPRARLEWVMRLRGTPATWLMGAAARVTPWPVWSRLAALPAVGTLAGQTLGAGRVAMAGRASNGQRFVLRPARVLRIAASAALLDGRDLGGIAPHAAQTRLGDFWLPNTGLFALGEARFDLFDAAAHGATYGGRIERC